jgi:hypothetical protein
MERLYGVKSFFKKCGFEKNVHVGWRVADREDPVCPYEEGIADYQNLRRKEREEAQRGFDKYFTIAEAAALKQFLERVFNCRALTEIFEIPLPVISKELINLNDDSPYPPGYGSYDLTGEEGYDLPFEVYGEYWIEG